MEELRTSHGIQGNAAFYLSIPPSLFPNVLKQMQRTGLADKEKAGGWRRVVVEKPFGHDLPSALELNNLVDTVFPATDVYRIDHYLGKETVQNLLALRFANQLFEPVWNGNFVDSVQITMAEDVGIGGRAAFYHATGAARDVLQNHLLQLLALTAMEEPVEFSPEAVRIEKIKALRAISLPPDLEAYAIRGQYDQGWLAGERAVAYLEEEGIPEGSTDRDLRRRPARRRDPALGRRAVLHAHRQAAAEAGHRDLGAVQEGAAPAVQQDRHAGARAQPARHPGAAGRGRHAEVRLEGAGQRDGGPRRRDGLPLRRGVHRVLAGGVRAVDPRRAHRRRHPLPALGGGRGVLAGDRPARGRSGPASPRTCTGPANGVRRRPTRCSPATDASGEGRDHALGHHRDGGRQGAGGGAADGRGGDERDRADARRRRRPREPGGGRGGRDDRGEPAPDADARRDPPPDRRAGAAARRRGHDRRPARAGRVGGAADVRAARRCTPSR